MKYFQTLVKCVKAKSSDQGEELEIWRKNHISQCEKTMTGQPQTGKLVQVLFCCAAALKNQVYNSSVGDSKTPSKISRAHCVW